MSGNFSGCKTDFLLVLCFTYIRYFVYLLLLLLLLLLLYPFIICLGVLLKVLVIFISEAREYQCNRCTLLKACVSPVG